ncbi:DUF58 domain-containing protein [Tessaracoccus antarcticus]|uniref:DUF58 domain-containing protein n=1 Tax=Tessaracoccus antarcticus TaxID=2479848 RepID=A0A3M0G4D2_9ACTN|nr:DUF58 domain-containing protein [Tessaracoccus antarcticus]RMB59860.1 DUF58 domain-containing protein [Tessaracoccus antarcticus]
MHLSHTPALLRSLVAAAVLGVVAVMVQRVDVVVLMVPFVVHLAWGWRSRPHVDLVVESRPKAVVIPEGESVSMVTHATHAWRSALVTLQWPVRPGISLDPDSGTVLDAAVPEGVRVAVQPERWGRYDVGPGTVAVCDPSGSWRASTTTPRVTVTVRPTSSSLEGGSGVAHPIGIVGMHRSRRRGDGSDLAEVREFRPGDRLRRINWRVTSRLGALHVNSTLTERDTDVLIVADTLVDIVPARPEAPTSLDATVRAIAAISRHYGGFGDRVAIHDLGRRIGHVRPGTGPRHARMVLNVLSRANRDVPDWDRLRPVGTVTSGMLVFFCSPLLERESQDELVRLRRLGAEVIGVDTLPEGVGQFGDIRSFRRDTFLGEAWMIRRMERDEALARLRSIGIPVTPWRGTSSLASVLLSMEAARSAPRRVPGR